jgi:hypothetical protein
MILPRSVDNLTGSLEWGAGPSLRDVAELMQHRAAASSDVLLDRTASLLWGVAEMHRFNGRMTNCSECNNLHAPMCPLIETATEVAFAWLIRQARD